MDSRKTKFSPPHKKRGKRKLVMIEDNTFPLLDYSKRLMVHPRTLIRKLTGLENPAYGFIEKQVIHVEDVARKLGCDKWRLQRIMQGKDAVWTTEQACESFSISKQTFRRYGYPKLIDGHKFTRYSREQLTTAHFKNVEI